jgi:hypothetical protein
MHGLPPLGRLPLIPERILREHRVNEPSDTRFSAAARMLQAPRVKIANSRLGRT